MIHKSSAMLALLTLGFTFFAGEARAERRSISVTDSSTSGKLVRVNLGANVGMRNGEPVLFSLGEKKIAAGRVFRVEERTAVVAVLEKYGSETPIVDADYELLFGEPFDEAANLPDYVADREEELDNPANETFFDKKDQDTTPELDDDNYTPEVTLRPKLPLPRTYSPHNLTLGVALFRNRSLPTTFTETEGETVRDDYESRQGYTVRYAYSFPTQYWLRSRTTALLSIEGTIGIYNFDHSFDSEDVAQIRVLPLGFNLRYLVELSKLFRVYPYLGFQYNLVSVVKGSLSRLEPLMGGRILGGAGAQLVMSEAVDARLEGGSDGILAGIVVKF